MSFDIEIEGGKYPTFVMLFCRQKTVTLYLTRFFISRVFFETTFHPYWQEGFTENFFLTFCHFFLIPGHEIHVFSGKFFQYKDDLKKFPRKNTIPLIVPSEHPIRIFWIAHLWTHTQQLCRERDLQRKSSGTKIFDDESHSGRH